MSVRETLNTGIIVVAPETCFHRDRTTQAKTIVQVIVGKAKLASGTIET